MKTNIIIDLSNIVWANRHTMAKFSRDLLIHRTLSRIRNIANETRATGIFLACDGGRNWRKEYYPEYKGNRDHDADEHFAETLEAMEAVREFFNECTAIPAIKVVGAEADDVIYWVCKHLNVHNIKVVSSDKDFIQLITDGVELYDPKTKEHTQSANPDYDLFVKCIRGDRSDNIFSAFPRVRETRLARAWVEKTEMANIMETVRPDGEKVGDVYRFNKQLIDLSQAPQRVHQNIEDEVVRVLNSGSKYNAVKTLRFLSQYGLKNIAKDLDKYKRVLKLTFDI